MHKNTGHKLNFCFIITCIKKLYKIVLDQYEEGLAVAATAIWKGVCFIVY